MNETTGDKVELTIDLLAPKYASVGKRFAAMLLDGLIFIFPAILVSILIPYVGAILISLIYQPLFESSAAQATPGKRIMGIHVESIHRERITYRNALTRYMLSSVSELLIMFGHFFVFFTDKKQTLYDILAETIVVEGDTSASLKDAWKEQLQSLFSKA